MRTKEELAEARKDKFPENTLSSSGTGLGQIIIMRRGEAVNDQILEVLLEVRDMTKDFLKDLKELHALLASQKIDK